MAGVHGAGLSVWMEVLIIKSNSGILIFRQQYRHSALPAEPADKGTAPVSLLNPGVKQNALRTLRGHIFTPGNP